ncbi:MAG: DUF2188 domain-containing protein [Ruminococcaceae bacterium]|nr:DUF2188 domain-containing protein [Oscillospiraceae bacterium]
MSKNSHIISPTKDGSWVVQKNGSDNRSIQTKTKVEAIIIGKVISLRSGDEWIIDETAKDSHQNKE